MASPETKLDKYKLMVDEYMVNDFNGRKAYQKYNPKANDRTADTGFSLILTIPEVQAYYQERKKEAKQALRTSHEALLEELERWAYLDVREFILLSPKQVKELPPEIGRLITGFEHKTRILTDGTRIDTIKCTFVSKEKAMEMIHKHTGFYAEDNFQKNVVLSNAERKEILQKIAERRKRIEEKEIEKLM